MLTRRKPRLGSAQPWFWQQFDVVIVQKHAAYWNLSKLIAAGVPAITMHNAFADELGLGSGATMHASIDSARVVDTHHLITNPLQLGPYALEGKVWTDATNPSGFAATTLVDSGRSDQAILVVNNVDRHAYFGWYRTSQLGPAALELLCRTIEWAAR